jgi:hypothetical protein
MSDTHQNPALEAFLTADQAASSPPAPPPEPQATQPEPKSAPAPSKTPEAKPQATPPPDDDDGEHDDGSGTVPLATLKKAREDYKLRAARAEGELAAIRAQLEAATKPQMAAQPEQPRTRPAPPDPARDPGGYHVWQQTERINDKLDMSEAMLRNQLGDDAVDQMQKDFKAAAERDETLWGKLYSQPHPYAWAHRQVQQQRVVAEVGTDPDAYRNRLRSEIEAQVRAELGLGQGGAPPPSAAAGIPPSLANVRSSAPRGQTFSGPPAMDDIVGRRSGDIFAKQR